MTLSDKAFHVDADVVKQHVDLRRVLQFFQMPEHGDCPTGHESTSHNCFHTFDHDAAHGFCYHCGKQIDVFAIVQARHQCEFLDAAKFLIETFAPDLAYMLGGVSLTDEERKLYAQRAAAARQAAVPPAKPIKRPPADLQTTLREIVEVGQQNLMNADDALLYLESRGIDDSSISRFALGYSPGFAHGGIYVSRGILFPCIVSGRVWYIKVRRIHARPCPRCGKLLQPGEACEPCKFKHEKMIHVSRDQRGDLPEDLKINAPALYNADSLLTGETALVCEGEIDCMTLSQELGLPVVTLGGVSQKIDLLSWGSYLLNIRRALVIKDNDEAGARLTWAADVFGKKAVDVKLPDGVKDPNDLLVKAKRLFSWAVKTLLTPVQQTTFHRAFDMLKQCNMRPEWAARCAWHETIQSGRKWTAAEERQMFDAPLPPVMQNDDDLMYDDACLNCQAHANNPACRACRF